MGREEELEVARAALASDDAAGIVISGEPGVGKTRVAEELLTELSANGTHVLRLMATRAAATIPFGAAATLLGDGLGADVLPEPATLDAAREAIAQRARGRSLVVGVDDAHLLDDATAQLVYHLAGTRDARVVLTVRRAERAPSPVDALRNDHRCHRLELQPLGRDDVTALLAQALGGQVEQHSAENLWRVTAGNVLFLRELCRDAMERGTLVRRHGTWTWTGGPVLGARLQELLDARLGGLTAAEHEAAALLALGEPLPRSMLVQLTPARVVDELTSRGVATEDHGVTAYESTIRLSHPLYAEGLRGRLGPLETADLYSRLADGLASRGMSTPDDRLRVAVWSIGSSRAVPTDLLVVAARDALARGDSALAERLARAATNDPRGALALGEALAARRRGVEAEKVLAPLASGSLDAEDLAAVYVARLAAHRSPDLPLAAARQLAEEAREVFDQPERRDLIEAALADTLCDRGRVSEAGSLALDLLGSPSAAARAMAVGPACTWLVATGRSEDAVRIGNEALADALAHQHELAWAPGLVVGHLGTALLSTGRLDQLTRLCEAAQAPPLAPTGRSQGIVALLQGAAALVQGRPETARSALREAVLSFERADATGRHARALALLAEAEALLGDLDGAQRTLAAMPTDGVRHADFDRERAELCVIAGQGDVRAAALRSIELANAARAAQAPFFELAMAYTAVRFGAADVASRVVAVAEKVQGAIAEAFGEHAAALADDDGPQLERAATRLADMGCRLLAAEAFVHAALAHQRAGLTARARAAVDHADRLRAQCEGARTPVLSQGAIVSDLTRREREVAWLAAGGMTSREIGQRLGISIRTVDNQLGRVYNKLGVTGRSELARRLSTAPADRD